jgi:glyoxylase-like metal-dependent hydrolase (beta-lactamase superfamily II)
VSTTSRAKGASTVVGSEGAIVASGGQYNPWLVAPSVHRLSHRTSWFDLEFDGRRQRIAAGLLQHGQGIAVVDPGPTSCLPRLEAGLSAAGVSVDELTHVLLTHIHLDHAGVTGVLAQRNPRLRVVVHERGSRHLIDPSRLLASAARLYGADMDRLWGRCEPISSARLDVVTDGDVVRLADRRLDVAYTPGHASHHVCYFDPDTRIAWVGDTAGVWVEGGYILPPTPPPDIDLDAWQASLVRIGRWHAEALFLTHCGPTFRPAVHLRTLAETLTSVGAWALELLQTPLPEADRQRAFEARVRRELRREMPEAQATAYESAAAFTLMWGGLARYWRTVARLAPDAQPVVQPPRRTETDEAPGSPGRDD